MTGSMIFKMEMLKFRTDKAYLLWAIGLGIANTLMTLLVISGIEAYIEDMMWLFIFPIAFFLVAGSAVLMFIYPFRAVSVDYKNNVMAMMIASGVNRTKLFFAKVGAITLSTLIISAILALLPMLIVLFKLGIEVGFREIVEGFSEFFWLMEFSGISFLFNTFFGYLQLLVVMIFASIFLKGSNLSFLLFIGINMAISMVTSIVTIPFMVATESMNLYFFITSLMNVIVIGLFVFLSLRTLNRQNL